MEYQGKTLLDYIDVLRKDYKLFLFPFIIISLLSGMFALTLPSIYRSQGVILVESQQIPDDLIRSTIRTYADERIQIMKQLVMTRENLTQLISKYDLYNNHKGRSLSIQEKLDRIRKNIYIELIRDNLQPQARFRGRRNSLTFVVAFEHTDPTIAQKVANDLVTLFLQENLKARTKRATETTEFLTNEAEKLRKQINIIEQQVAEYKQKHEQSLPENLGLNNQMLERAQNTLREIERDIKSEEEQLSYLEVQLAALESALPDDAETPLTPQQQLAQLKSRLTELQNRYGPRHPDIRKTKRQIQQLEKELQTNTLESEQAYENPAQMLIHAKIKASQETIKSLRKQEQELRATIAELQNRIMQTPQVERGLRALERDYENLKEKYDDLMAKATEATLSQSMEEQSKAERFTLIEPPIFPEKPIRPNRPKLLIMGLMIAFGASIGLVILKDELKGGIRNVRQLTRLTGQTPLVTIGYIDNNSDIIRRKRQRKIVIILIFLIIITILALINFLYKPLGEIADIIGTRF